MDLENFQVWNVPNTQNTDRGISIEDTSRAGGELYVYMRDVLLINNPGPGAFIRRQGGLLTAVLWTVAAGSNGWGVDEQLAGGMDGIEFNQVQDGDLNIYVKDSVFFDNSEDGLDIEENGAGTVLAILEDVECVRSHEEGIEVTEGGNGDLLVTLDRCDVDDTFKNANDGDRNGDGIELNESGEGILQADLYECTVTDCDKDGIRFVPDGVGNCIITVDDCTVDNCAAGGICYEASDDIFSGDFVGESDILITESRVTNNAEGIRAITAMNNTGNNPKGSPLDPALPQGKTGRLDIQSGMTGDYTTGNGNDLDTDSGMIPSTLWDLLNEASTL